MYIVYNGMHMITNLLRCYIFKSFLISLLLIAVVYRVVYLLYTDLVRLLAVSNLIKKKYFLTILNSEY